MTETPINQSDELTALSSVKEEPSTSAASGFVEAAEDGVLSSSDEIRESVKAVSFSEVEPQYATSEVSITEDLVFQQVVATEDSAVKSDVTETRSAAVQSNIAMGESEDIMSSGGESIPQQTEGATRQTRVIDEDVIFGNDIVVSGTMRAKLFLHPYGALYYSYDMLLKEHPWPRRGMWALVGGPYPSEIYRCEEDGAWVKITGAGTSTSGCECDIAEALKGYATQDWVKGLQYMNAHQSLEDYATIEWVLKKLKGYAVAGDVDVDLSGYVTIDTEQEITGQKRFTKSIKLGTAEDYVELSYVNGALHVSRNILVTGEITAYAEGDSSEGGSGSGSGSGGGASYLRELLDVSIPGVPAPGQVLTWSTSALNGAGGWVASTIKSGLDESALGTYLSNHNYVTDGDVSTAISNAIKGIDLSDYVTNDSLELSLRKYVTIDTDQEITGAKRFTREVTLGTAEDNITLSYADGALHISGHILVRGEITAYALGGGGSIGAGLLLGGLADVDAAGAEDGMALVYRDGRWVPGAVAAGGMDESALSAYLTQHEYLTRSTADDCYFYHRRDESGINIDTDITSAAGGLYELLNPAGALPYGSGGKWYKIMDWGSDDPRYRVQLAAGYSEDHSLFRRQKISGTWRAWTKILDEANYAEVLDSRYVNAAGDTITGDLYFTNKSTMRIYLNSNWINFASQTGQPFWMGTDLHVQGNIYAGANYNQLVWHQGNDGPGSGLDADMLDGYHESSYFRSARGQISTAYIDLTDYGVGAAGYANHNSGTYSIPRSGYSELFVNLAINYSSTSALQFRTRYADNADLMIRKTIDGNRVSGPWRAVLTEVNIGNYNAGSATRLQTARKLWGQSFDGSGDVSGDMTGVGTVFGTTTAAPYLKHVERTDPALGALGSALGIGWAPGLYGLYVWSYGDGSARLQAGRADGNTAAYPILINPLGGNVGINKTSPSYALDVNGQIRAVGWLRQTGDAGWYNETYGGGMYMIDSTWVRVYNGKNLATGGVIQSGYYFDRQGYVGASWNYGYGAYNVQITNNSSQTPLLLAYRQGQSPTATGANRLFAMELLNSGSLLRFCFGGAHKFEMYSTGNMLVTGEITAYSDARLKRDIRNVVARGRLRPVSYIKDGARHVGLLAQEVDELCPEAVTETQTDERYLALCYNAALVYGFAGVYSEIDELRERVRELETELQRYRRANMTTMSIDLQTLIAPSEGAVL